MDYKINNKSYNEADNIQLEPNQIAEIDVDLEMPNINSACILPYIQYSINNVEYNQPITQGTV